MREVVILTLGEGSACGGAGCACGAGDRPRVSVLACADALRAQGNRVELVTAGGDTELDATLKPVIGGDTRLVVAAATDGEVRAVVRRLVRHHAPPPAKRPDALAPDRTMLDLPPMAILPLSPGVPDLVVALRLPRDPGSVADAVTGGHTRQIDLLRTGSGSATLHGALAGSVAIGDQPIAWRGRVEVDDAILTDGDDPLLACSIRNTGSSDVDGLPLVEDARADDGLLDVAVAVPVLQRRLLRNATVTFEVRRTRGRAVSITPREDDLPFVDDGVAGVLRHQRSWWVERAAWSLYVM